MNLKITVAILAVILVILIGCIPAVKNLDRPVTALPPESSGLPEDTQCSQPTGTVEVTEPSADPTEPSAAPTEPSAAPTEPSAAPTEPTSQPPTQATTPESTQPLKPTYSDNSAANSFILARLDEWVCPLKDSFGEVTGSRTFGSGRSGGTRAHAGLDFVAPHGTKVYAVTSGTVYSVALFYQNTYAVAVLNDDGSILRYCEIATELKEGDYVRQGDLIGKILRADGGTEMLHMEVYMGNTEGRLTQTGNTTYTYVKNKNYMRRSDLLDPTFLKDLRQLT